MKIAVYTIAKNEEQFVKSWANSCTDADYRFILDTGSTDNTFKKAKELGIECETALINPWRFDIARNKSLQFIPNDIDYCIALDMDEVLMPGWRKYLEQIPEGTTRPRYKYVWSWKEDGSEGLVYGGDKIHARHGYIWKHPVHEVITPSGISEVQAWTNGLEIHHHPDQTKSRGQYFPLLKLAVEEDPNDDRNQFYLAREYFFHGMNTEAMGHFEKFLTLSVWPPERAAAWRYMASINAEKREKYLYNAVAEDPMRRENWVALAKLYYERNDWPSTKSCCEMAFRVKEKPLDYLCDGDVWGSLPHDLMAIACYNMGDYKQAYEQGLIALEANPSEQRLKNNLEWYKDRLK